MGLNLHDLGLDNNDFLAMTPDREWTLTELKLLFFQGNYQESEKITQSMGNNICKSYIYLIRVQNPEYINLTSC